MPAKTEPTGLSQIHADSWIPQTRLRPPRLRTHLLQRPQLLQAGRRAVQDHRLTLVSAPAGYGKTTFSALLLAALPEMQAAWLSLHEEDNQPISFLHALLAALRAVAPDFGARTATLLNSLHNPHAEMRKVGGVFINEVLETIQTPTILVLDDLHMIHEPAIYSGLDFLLEHMPESMRVIIASRYDPPLSLARLRAYGQLAEIRAPDLRFSRAETDALFNEILGFGLNDDELNALDSVSEGWITGLQLIAGTLPHAPAPERLAQLQRLGQTHQHVFELLAQEVLDRQPPHLRQFMLHTALLGELTPSKCRTLTGNPDAGFLLEELYRRNLLLGNLPPENRNQPEADPGSHTPLPPKSDYPESDYPESVYRYHALLANFLRHRLLHETPPDQIQELHRRAAAAETSLTRRMEHLLAGRLWAEAVETIEAEGRDLIRFGRLDQLRAWIETLPESTRAAHPRLALLWGVGATQRGELNEAQDALERARAGFEAQGDESGMGESLVALTGLANARHDSSACAAYYAQAITKPLSDLSQIQLIIDRLWQSIYQADWEEVARCAREAIRLTLESSAREPYLLLALRLRKPLLLIPDGPNLLEHYSQTVLRRFGEEIGPIQAGAHSLLSGVYLWRAQLDAAERAARRAQTISAQLGGYVFIDLGINLVLSVVYCLRQDYASFDRYWEKRLPQVQQVPGAAEWLPAIYCSLARAAWAAGDLETAQTMFAKSKSDGRAHPLPETTVIRHTVGALLALERDPHPRLDAAIRANLHSARAIQQKMRHTLIFTNARAIHAYLELRHGDSEAARAILQPLLQACAESNTPGPLLVDSRPIAVALLHLAQQHDLHPAFCTAVLGKLGAEAKEAEETPPRQTPRDLTTVTLPATGATLTPREAEVLGLLVSGHSNKAIAEELVITTRTVKSHVTAILRKLDVDTRAQAAARARSLNLF